MQEFFRKALFYFPPEVAHLIAMSFFRLWQWTRFKLLKKRPFGAPAVFSIPNTTLKFPSRLGLAAGFDKNAEVFALLPAFGFGFIEVGTVTPLAQPGNPKPRIFRVSPNALVNHMGFNSLGVKRVRENILRYQAQKGVVPLLANLGKNRNTKNEEAIKDYRAGFHTLRDCVDGFVVNLSSPNTPGLFDLQTTEFLEQLVAAAPVDKPLFVKLSPDLDDKQIETLCEQILSEKRWTGVILTNTSRKLAALIAHKEEGGLSGPPLFQRSLHCVKLAKEILKDRKLIVGVGGVSSIENAKDLRKAGADLIEIYTAFLYEGPKRMRAIANALNR